MPFPKDQVATGIWAITDQGLFAFSNFSINIILARWLSQEEYGAFTIVYAVFLLLGTFHTAFFTEPMLVFGQGKFKHGLTTYLGFIICEHWKFTIPPSLLLLIMTGLLWNQGYALLSVTFLSLAFMTPVLLFQWLMRRSCFIRLSPHLAAYAGVINMVIVFIILGSLYHWNHLSPSSALITMGGGSLISGVFIFVRLKIKINTKDRMDLKAKVWREHWNFGRWAAPTNLVLWISSQIYCLILPIWGGLEASAALRALMNLIMPMMTLIGALPVVIIPELVKLSEQPNFLNIVFQRAIWLSIGPILYWLILIFWGKEILQFLYSGKYQGYDVLFVTIGLIPVCATVVLIVASALKALERPDKAFWAYLAASLVTLSFGIGLTISWGISGAIIGWLISYIAAAGTIILFFSSVNSRGTNPATN